MPTFINNKSEEKLDGKELEKVNGGIEYTITSLNVGDCFSYRVPNCGATFLMCRNNYPNIESNTIIEFDLYISAINDKGYQGKNSVIASKLSSGIYGYDYYYSNKNYIPK